MKLRVYKSRAEEIRLNRAAHAPNLIKLIRPVTRTAKHNATESSKNANPDPKATDVAGNSRFITVQSEQQQNENNECMSIIVLESQISKLKVRRKHLTDRNAERNASPRQIPHSVQARRLRRKLT